MSQEIQIQHCPKCGGPVEAFCKLTSPENHSYMCLPCGKIWRIEAL
jgi:hypothetical protein